jgi:hypothetical protein
MPTSASYDSRDATHSPTTQLLFALLAGNLVAFFCAIAFRPFAGPVNLGKESSLVMMVGVLSLVAAGLLFLASAMRRRATPWWIVALALNATQLARLVPAIVAIAAWADGGDWTGMFWAFLFVPFLGVLSAIGLVVTLREARRSRRRRLARAA